MSGSDLPINQSVTHRRAAPVRDRVMQRMIELPRAQFTVSIGIAALLLVLVLVELMHGWDDARELASSHLLLIMLCVGLVALPLATVLLDWASCWSYVSTRQPQQVAIALVVMTSMLAIFAARIEEKRDLETATVFLFVGLMSAWFAKTALGLQENALYVAILLVPLVTYLALSGRFKLLELPGGTKIELENAGLQVIEPASAALLLPNVPISAGIENVADCGVRNVAANEAFKFVAPGEGQSTVVIPSQLVAEINLGDLRSYVLRYPVIRNFVIVNEQCQVVAFGRADTLKTVLASNGDAFMSDAAHGDFAFLSKYPGMSNATIKGVPTIAQAMEAFDAQHVDAIAIVGSEVGRFVGIIDREDVVNRLLLNVINASTKTPES